MRNVRSVSGSGPASVSASARGTPNQEKRGGESGKHGKEESVPLEFEEEDDDDFVVGKVDTDDIAHASATTPISRTASSGDGHQASLMPLPAEVPPSAVMQPIEDEEGWGEEDHAAIVEAERFEDLSVVGLMDEEQQEQDRLRAGAAAAQEGDDGGAGKKKKNKKKRAE